MASNLRCFGLLLVPTCRYQSLRKFYGSKKSHQWYRELMETDKRHLRDFNSISRRHFHLFIKEYEWHFYYRPAARLFETLLGWA